MEHLYHFNLTQDPFQNEPDLRFYFESETHRGAQLRIDRALRQSKGLVVLTGEGGTGKSLLARRLFEALEEEVFESALMVMMQGTADTISVLRRFAAQLGVEDPPSERAALIGLLYEQLAIVREDGRHVVLILDDAHVLGREAMAEIGALMNLEYEDRRLMSLLLVGLPELDTMVAGIPSLGERVDVRVPLQPLGEVDAQAYVAHRVQAAGGDPAIFDDAAVQTIFKLGGGRPRRMNALADNALFEAFLGGRTTVGAEDVESAGADLAFEGGANPVAMPQQASVSASAPAPKAPPLLQEAPPLAAATQVVMKDDDAPKPPPMAEPVITDDMAHDPVSTAGPPAGMAEATMLIDDLATGGDDGELDLGSLLDGGDEAADAEELHLAEPVEDASDSSFPSFAAENSAAPMAEATRIALPDETAAGASPAGAGELTLGETTDADEIDDLFVELLDD